MSSGPAMGVETKARLRASCNACNESKVRCSQGKPTCARCERNETECVYGLSRRTHKDAPPISFPPSQRGRKPPRSGSGSRLTASGSTSATASTNGNSPSTTTTASNGCVIPDEQVDVHNDKANLFHDYMFPTATESDTMHSATHMLDFSSLVSSTANSTTMTPGYFSTTSAEYASSTARDFESLFGANHNSDAMDMSTYQTPNSEDECTCHTGVMTLLAMMRSGGAGSSGSSVNGGHNNSDRRTSIDTQLAKLRQCIMSSEKSMRCSHGREDSEPIHIMAVAMLIGYAIDDFKVLASESSMRRSSSLSSSSSMSSSSSSSAAAAVAAAEMAIMENVEIGCKYRVTSPNGANVSPRNFAEPRLSWGVLELEEDDEMDLRHRLYLLSFRKLERLLSQLTAYIQQLHSALVSLPDPSRHMAFVIVCDYTRLWLEKKASDVKRLFSVCTRDEMMDSMFG